MAEEFDDQTTGTALTGFEGRGGAVQVGRTNFAVGLIWRDEDEASGKKAPAQAREAAAERKADLFGLRSPGQFCLGSTRHGHKAGMPSLAATLAATLQGSFIGAFTVENGIYVVAVQQDGVLATYDIVYADPEEAHREFLDLVHSGGWDQKFCPAEWEIADSKPTSMEIMLAGASKLAKLRQVSQKALLIKLAVIMTFIAVGVLGYQQYENYLADQAVQAEIEARSAEAAAARAARDAAARAIPDFPWKDAPVAQYALDACVAGILQAPTSVPGWSVTSIACDGANGTVSMSLRREPGGTLNWIGFTLNREGFRPSIRQNTTTSVDVTWPLASFAALPRHTNDTQTGQASAAMRYLLMHFEELYAPLTQRITPGTTAQIPDPANPNRTQPVLMSQSLDIELAARHDPREFLPILAPLRAATLTRVTLSTSDWTWKVEGKIHERLFNPAPTGPARAGAPAR